LLLFDLALMDFLRLHLDFSNEFHVEYIYLFQFTWLFGNPSVKAASVAIDFDELNAGNTYLLHFITWALVARAENSGRRHPSTEANPTIP